MVTFLQKLYTLKNVQEDIWNTFFSKLSFLPSEKKLQQFWQQEETMKYKLFKSWLFPFAH